MTGITPDMVAPPIAGHRDDPASRASALELARERAAGLVEYHAPECRRGITATRCCARPIDILARLAAADAIA